MLPILPALLLLILQGPSSVEKLALEGRLPAALEAIHRQMEARDTGSPSFSKADEAMLASFLAMGNDPQISHALIKLLSLGEPVADAKSAIYLVVEDVGVDPPPLAESSSGKLAEGFAKSQRSRDGPF